LTGTSERKNTCIALLCKIFIVHFKVLYNVTVLSEDCYVTLGLHGSTKESFNNILFLWLYLVDSVHYKHYHGSYKTVWVSVCWTLIWHM